MFGVQVTLLQDNPCHHSLMSIPQRKGEVSRYTGDWPAVLALVLVVGAGLQLWRRGRELRAA